MKPAARAWVEKAEGDYRMAASERRRRKEPCFDGVCFHAQQCIEKYLKALLQEADLRFERTHNLLALLVQLAPVMPELTTFRDDLRDLSQYAVVFRYPGHTADRALAREAMKQVDRIREACRRRLGLVDPTPRPRRKRGRSTSTSGNRSGRRRST